MVSGSEIYGQESEEQDRNVNVLCHIMIAEDQKSVKEIITCIEMCGADSTNTGSCDVGRIIQVY